MQGKYLISITYKGYSQPFPQDIDRNPVNNGDYSQCGRNASGILTFSGNNNNNNNNNNNINVSGTDKSFTAAQYEAQPGEFPHMCVIYR